MVSVCVPIIVVACLLYSTSIICIHICCDEKRGWQFCVVRFRMTYPSSSIPETGLTTKHYTQMVDLYAKFRDGGLEILAFPCNQFDNQEPYSDSDIHAFAKRFGVEFRMMSKIDVNGPGQHEVYRFLKEKMGQEEIEWNFASYFVVNRKGRIKSYNGGSPKFLETYIEAAING